MRSNIFIPAVVLIIAVYVSLANAESFNVLNAPAIPINTTVTALPTCTASNSGVVYRVTDSLVPALGVAVAGGGAVAVIVRCNGTSWLVGQ